MALPTRTPSMGFQPAPPTATYNPNTNAVLQNLKAPRPAINTPAPTRTMAPNPAANISGYSTGGGSDEPTTLYSNPAAKIAAAPPITPTYSMNRSATNLPMLAPTPGAAAVGQQIQNVANSGLSFAPTLGQSAPQPGAQPAACNCNNEAPKYGTAGSEGLFSNTSFGPQRVQ